jgi:tetratricopeptide (TPR) repeat protein
MNAARAMTAEPSAFAEDALLAHALLGGGLPEEANWHLWQAGLSYHLGEVAEAHLRQAEAIAPGHAAVLIGLYRFYFYKGRLAECLEVARICLAKAQRETNLPADWRDVAPEDALFGRYEALMPRFFLFTLKGYAYLHMRLGNLAEGRAAAEKLLQLDPADRIGARVLIDVLDRAEAGDD